ncbi:MAG: energy-coupling factor ABC transporter ATP-binding protein [Chlorobium sp.]|nr:energy-coupling factor ABC transporter ATP-binding protein [Chlorobium sp.]MCW8819693.1 energy-coupling factor ABC transporter ATP-binding protein [Ignavibacteriaceae bacterium]
MNSITVHDLCFSYPGNVEVFGNLNMSIGLGEKAGISGANGSGKSTLFLLLMGLLKPESGTIMLRDTIMKTEHDFKNARVKTGFLFQDPDDQLFCPTVEEDIAFGLLNRGMERTEAGKKVDALCEMLRISHLKKRVPFHLSWGQKRLVSLAGVLVLDPELLLLDEPTSGVDDQVTETLLDFLDSFSGTMLVSSHDTEFLDRVCHSRYSLSNNRLDPVPFSHSRA